MKLGLESTIKKGEYAGKTVADLVKISGKILALIKEGYDFDDEVLEAAHIKKSISGVKVYQRVGGLDCVQQQSKLPKDTVSIKQILSEISTIDKIGEYDNSSENTDSLNIGYENEVDTINIDNFDSENE